MLLSEAVIMGLVMLVQPIAPTAVYIFTSDPVEEPVEKEARRKKDQNL